MQSCLMSIPLPKYEIARIQTGQWIRGEKVLLPTSMDDGVACLPIVSKNSRVRSDSDILLGTSVLIYTKEPGTLSDKEALFFLHVYQTDKLALPWGAGDMVATTTILSFLIAAKYSMTNMETNV